MYIKTTNAKNNHSGVPSTSQQFFTIKTSSQELIECCQSDVEFLCQGVVQSQTLINLICSGIDPFEIVRTAASTCNYIYRQLITPMNRFGILPINGYRSWDATFFPAS